MVTKRNSLSLAALVGIGLALGASSQAQVIVQTFTIPLTPTPFTSSFTYNNFDTSLGELFGVTITLNTSIVATVEVVNKTAVTQNFTNATATVPLELTGPGPVDITATAVAGPFSGSVLGAPPAVTFFPAPPANASTSVTLPSSEFSLYEIPPSAATVTLTVTAGAGSYTGTANGGTLLFGGFASASGTITITYQYAPAGSIPEPGTTTFFAAGILGSLGLVLRRRKKA